MLQIFFVLSNQNAHYNKQNELEFIIITNTFYSLLTL